MRLAFMGTPAFAVPTLDALAAAGHDVAAVYTQPPRAAGRRGRALTPSPVQLRAEALGIEVRTPLTLRDPAEQAAFAALDLDAAIVAAYGLILPPPILDAPRHGCLNVHASLLPRWRGAAPIQRAILAGDAVTGVTIMDMERGLDTGPIRAQSEVAIDRKGAGTLTDELARAGAELMVRVLGDLPRHPPTPQPEAGVTYAAKVDKAETQLDLTRAAAEVERQIRAFAPTPGAWIVLGGERVRLLAVEVTDGDGPAGTVLDERLTIACGIGAVRPTRLQRAGRQPMTAAEALRGLRPVPGTQLA